MFCTLYYSYLVQCTNAKKFVHTTWYYKCTNAKVSVQVFKNVEFFVVFFLKKSTPGNIPGGTRANSVKKWAFGKILVLPGTRLVVQAKKFVQVTWNVRDRANIIFLSQKI